MSLQSIVPKDMSKQTENREKRYRRKTAIAMYDTGFSMRQIQKELGNVMIADIRAWSAAEAKKENWPKRDKKPKKQRNKQKALKEYGQQEKQREWKEKVFSGWKDTPEQAAFRRSPEYQKWRIVVLERDKYTCQHCETTGGRLVVHHVKTFKMNPELRLEPDNGIVLCNNCHEKLHLSMVKMPKVLRLA